jgi:RHS repeat-associated protein
VQFAGYLNKQATVTVAGSAAVVNHQTTNFVGYATMGLGTNTVPVVATDYSSNHNTQTNTYQLVVTNDGVGETITYDLNGNQTSVVTATTTNTYQWDAANRLVSITGPTNQSLFVYDGMGRRTQIIECQNGAALATNNFIWDGRALVEQRDYTGTNVTKRFFGHGEQISGTNYYFTRDHLGSVREVMSSAGLMQARYDYDLYGRQTLLAGTAVADFGYAGMFMHSPSGLNLTLYRAYNSDQGRWLTRDPAGEMGGLNLYEYVINNSVNLLDPLGLWNVSSVLAVTAGIIITAAAIAAAPAILPAVAVAAIVGGALGYAAAPDGEKLQGTIAGAVGAATGAATAGTLGPAIAGALGATLGDIGTRGCLDQYTAASALLGGVLGYGFGQVGDNLADNGVSQALADALAGGVGAGFAGQAGQTYIDAVRSGFGGATAIGKEIQGINQNN